jgi:hypothetical protein
VTLIDDRGRIFGRVNLVDAILLGVFLGLVPLAYGGYVLFRTPPPQLMSVEPQTLVLDRNPRLIVHGENLRPYMRVSFNNQQGRTFLFKDPTTAEIDIGDIAPGTYDVVLYDYARERARLPKALTVVASALPATSVLVIGSVANLEEPVAQKIVTGLKVNKYGSVIEAGRPVPQVTRVHSGANTVDIPVRGGYQVPVMIKVPCTVQMNGGLPTCTVEGLILAPDTFLQLETPFGPYNMQIQQVLGSEPLVAIEAVVRLSGNASVLALVRAGDVDFGTSRNELAAGARVLEVSPSTGGSRDVKLELRAQKSVDGWWYQGTALRAGGFFDLRTKAYDLQGSVLSITPTLGQ